MERWSALIGVGVIQAHNHGEDSPGGIAHFRVQVLAKVGSTSQCQRARLGLAQDLNGGLGNTDQLVRSCIAPRLKNSKRYLPGHPTAQRAKRPSVDERLAWLP
jgi:hypothetical protein